MNRGYSFGKTVVVGHWPVCIYRENGICHNVLFDYDKHIISIDGGCALKSDAQLNALLIPGAYSGIDEVKAESYDDYPVITAKSAQEGKAPQIIIRYFDSAVEIAEDGKDYAVLRQKSSGRVFAAPKTCLYKSGGELHCEDISDALLDVKEGDRLSVIADTACGMLVKKDGTTGWYRNNGKE